MSFFRFSLRKGFRGSQPWWPRGWRGLGIPSMDSMRCCRLLVTPFMIACAFGQTVRGPFAPPVPPIPANARAEPVPPAVQRRLDLIRSIDAADRGGPPGMPSGARAGAIALAKNKARSDDVAGAEELLALSNAFQPGTHHWHLETAHRLIELAQDMGREPGRAGVGTVVSRTLQRLDDAATAARKAADPRGEAAARSSAAFVHERFRGDPGAALAAYRAALAVHPEDESSREALQRLESSLANLRARGSSVGRGKVGRP